MPGTYSSALTVSDSTFAGNTASTSGGMISAAATTVTVTNATFSGNTATSSGGGVYVQAVDMYQNGSGTMTLADSTVSGN